MRKSKKFFLQIRKLKKFLVNLNQESMKINNYMILLIEQLVI